MFKNLKKGIKRAIVFILVLAVIVVLVITFTNLFGDKLFQQKTVKVWIDSDSDNQVDNLFAISRACISPELEILGLSSVQREIMPKADGNSLQKSQAVNEILLQLLNNTDIPHPAGSEEMLRFEGDPIADRTNAAEQIILKVKGLSKKEKLNIICLGASTNVASAIMIDPSIIPGIRLYLNAMSYDSKSKVWNKNEEIARNDLDALDILLNTENLEINIMPSSTSDDLFFRRSEIKKYLVQDSGVINFLANKWDEKFQLEEHGIVPAVAVIEAIIDPELARKEQVLTPPENRQRTIGVYTSINKELMAAEFLYAINKYNRNLED